MAHRQLGIFLGRNAAEACLVERRWRRSPRILARASAEAMEPLWTKQCPGLNKLFRALARSLPSEALRADVIHRISLPDPLISEDRMGFADLPEDQKEARDLILWRLSRALRIPPENIGCGWQVERKIGDKTEVLVRIVDSALLRAVLDAAASAGIFPSRLEGLSGYVLARPDVTADIAGARLWANDDWWTLMCWARLDRSDGADGEETLVHSEWFSDSTSVKSIADKVKRLAKTFALSSGVAQLSLELEVPEPLDADIRSSFGGADGLLSLADFVPISMGEADCVALDSF